MRVPRSPQTPLSGPAPRLAGPATEFRTLFVRNQGVLSTLARSVALHREQMAADTELARRFGG